MDWVSAKIALGGEAGHVMWRDKLKPVSWPEVRILQQLHGEANVFDCEFAYAAHSTAQAEKMRLLGLYGAEPVNLIYPGPRPFMEMQFPGGDDPAGEKRPERKPAPPIGGEQPEEEVALPPLPARAEA